MSQLPCFYHKLLCEAWRVPPNPRFQFSQFWASPESLCPSDSQRLLSANFLSLCHAASKVPGGQVSGLRSPPRRPLLAPAGPHQASSVTENKLQS